MFSFLLMSEEEIMQLAGRDFQINFNDVVLPQFIRLFSCFLCIWRQTAQPTLSRKSYSIIIIQIHSPTWAVGHVATRPDPDCQQGFRHGIMGSPVPNNLLSCRPCNDGSYDGPITHSLQLPALLLVTRRSYLPPYWPALCSVDGVMGPSYGPSLRGRQDSKSFGTGLPIIPWFLIPCP